jgi:hypothetical protein
MVIARFRRYRFGLWVTAAMLSGCVAQSASPVVPGQNSGVNAVSGSQTFHFTSTYQTFTVPSGVTRITVVARGAGGGLGTRPFAGARPGKGARVYAVLPVKPGETLYVFVGGTENKSRGGFNGGGGGGGIGHGHREVFDHGGGGGGASDLRPAYTANTRILVAAGGGGAGQFGNGRSGPIAGGDGGDGGYVGGRGGDGGCCAVGGRAGSGATRSAGGSGGVGGQGDRDYSHGKNGRLRQGGAGGRTGDLKGKGGAGGGGGGGYFGGGGGGGGAGTSSGSGSGGGGGGGSSYVEPSAIKFRFWGGWKNATGNGQIVISW